MARKRKPSGRRTANNRQRSQPNIPVHYTFLIVHEGQETEKAYFKSWRSDKIALQSEPVTGPQMAIVMEAKRLSGIKKYDEVWVAFDLDYDAVRGTQQYADLAAAIEMAEGYSFGIAYSIDAFEVWFRLHYEMLTGPLHRTQLYEDLSKRWNVKYAVEGKSGSFAATIPAILTADPGAEVNRALEFAEKLYESKKDLPLDEQNPITTVYKLIRRFQKIGNTD